MSRRHKDSEPTPVGTAPQPISPRTEPIAPLDGPSATPAAGDLPDAGTKPAGTGAPKQTLAGRVWVALAVAAILLVLMIIFIAENTKSITISFLGAHGHISEALALLLAVVVGIVICLLVGTARILQLSLEVRKQKRTVRKLS